MNNKTNQAVQTAMAFETAMGGAQQPAPQPMAAARPVSPLKMFNNFITGQRTQDYLTRVLGSEKNSFVNNIVSLVSNAPMLQRCEPSGVMYAALKATALKLPLDPNLGFAYVIPYGNKAQFQMGWRGFVQLALRTNLYRTINVRDVRAGEIVDEDFASGEMRFKALPPAERQQTPVVGYLAFFELTNGFRKMSYWTVEEIAIHGQKFSKTYNQGGSVWKTDFDAMAKKTVLKLLIGKFGPMSVDMQAALRDDQSVVDASGAESYADNDESIVMPVEGDDVAKEQTADDAAKVMEAAQVTEAKAAKNNNENN